MHFQMSKKLTVVATINGEPKKTWPPEILNALNPNVED